MGQYTNMLRADLSDIPRPLTSWIVILISGLASTMILAAPPARQVPWLRHTIDGTSQGADGVRWADVDGDGNLDLATPWEEGGVIRLYRYPSQGDVRQPWPRVTVGTAAAPEDAFSADIDQDGHLDVISCHEGQQREIRIAFGPAENSPFTDRAAWSLRPIDDPDPPQAWMFAVAGQWDGQGGLDVIAGSKNRGASVTLWLAPDRPRDREAWHLRKQRLRDAGWIMSLIDFDMDHDGDDDVVLSDRRGPTRGVFWLENPGAQAVRKQRHWQEHPIGGQDVEVMFIGAADFDQDSQPEWVAATLDARVVIFRQTGKAHEPWQSTSIALPAGYRRGKAVAAGDVDGDDNLDLVITTEDGCVAWLPEPKLAQNSVPNWQQINGKEGFKFDRVELRDLDRDGDLDIVTCEERHNLGVVWYENPR